MNTASSLQLQNFVCIDEQRKCLLLPHIDINLALKKQNVSSIFYHLKELFTAFGNFGMSFLKDGKFYPFHFYINNATNVEYLRSVIYAPF